ncbi:hypothetical protein [Nostoc sp.]|uniref:hypothetical protein n=1 Tax=Nostoc sp. TaxID=1180 RepID=UPI002FF4DD13
MPTACQGQWRSVKPAAWQLLETLRVACFPAGVRLERARRYAQSLSSITSITFRIPQSGTSYCGW